jgi:hypothetical protein
MRIAKVVALNLFASFLYRFFTLVHGFFSALLPIELSFFLKSKEITPMIEQKRL